MKRLEEQPNIAPSGRFWFFHGFIFYSKFSFFSYQFERILTIIKILKNLLKSWEMYLHILLSSWSGGSSEVSDLICFYNVRANHFMNELMLLLP